jgi:hypothetical protein
MREGVGRDLRVDEMIDGMKQETLIMLPSTELTGVVTLHIEGSSDHISFRIHFVGGETDSRSVPSLQGIYFPLTSCTLFASRLNDSHCRPV